MFFRLFLIFYSANASDLDELFKLCNKYREENGKPPFKRNSSLDKAAFMQAEFCAHSHEFSNTQRNSETKKEPIDRIKLCGMEASKVGESKARIPPEKTPQDVLEFWKKDEEENKNLLGDFEEAGFGSDRGCSSDDRYWFGCFATRNTEPQINQEKEIENKKGMNDNSNDLNKTELSGNQNENTNEKNEIDTLKKPYLPSEDIAKPKKVKKKNRRNKKRSYQNDQNLNASNMMRHNSNNFNPL